MPSTKSSRRGVALPRASSFHAAERGGAESEMLRRPRTVPNLIRSAADHDAIGAAPKKIAKLLFNVTIQRSLAAVRLVIPQESTVEELIAAALRQYEKESRLPALPSIDSSSFNLHYSQFSLESLDREEKVMNLGSRNFFMCARNSGSKSSCCAEEAAENSSRNEGMIPWLRFIDVDRDRWIHF